jgi:hypothetical protein
MGTGFKHGSGGGAALNFRVISGTSQPASPRENDIWVNTDYISSWVFASTEPENPTEGLVWIVTSNNSAVAFNALKKNSVMVYPLDAKQYTVGVWDTVAAKSYQNEAWVDWWPGQLYDNGKEYLNITGELTPYALDFSGTVNKAPTITKNDTNIVVTTDSTQYCGGLAYWANKIDLTNHTVLKFTGFCSDNSQNRAKVLVLSDLSKDAVAAEGVPATALSEIEIDISALSGSYYIGFSVSKGSSGNKTVTIEKVILV